MILLAEKIEFFLPFAFKIVKYSLCYYYYLCCIHFVDKLMIQLEQLCSENNSAIHKTTFTTMCITTFPTPYI